MNFLIILFSAQGIAIVLNLIKVISKYAMVSLLRFSYASFLLFSGFVKLIDPLGFSYKLQEYFEVFGFDWLIPLSLFLAIFILLFEVLLGIFLIFGIHVKKVMWGNVLLMLFFTFLTFFSAYFNKVTDCGCFGDFMKLDPWNSFIKDVYLLFISLILFTYQSKITSFMNKYYSNATESIKITNRLLIIIFLVLLFIPIYALSHLPFIDFRPYKVGVNIIDDRKLPEDAKKDIYKDIWYYEIDGETKEFLTSDEPWKISGAIFKDRATKLVSKGDEPKIHDFDIINEITGFNMTDSILSIDKVILVICYDIEKTNIDAHERINNFSVNALKTYNLPVYGLSSSSIDEIKDKLSTPELLYPYFLVDQTTLKTMIRANPGVFLLEDGVVVQKWHWRDLPDNLSGIIH